MVNYETIERTLGYADLSLSESDRELIENPTSYADGVIQGMKMAVRVHTDPARNASELIDQIFEGDRESSTEALKDKDKVIGMLVGVLEGSRLIRVISASDGGTQ